MKIRSEAYQYASESSQNRIKIIWKSHLNYFRIESESSENQNMMVIGSKYQTESLLNLFLIPSRSYQTSIKMVSWPLDRIRITLKLKLKWHQIWPELHNESNPRRIEIAYQNRISIVLKSHKNHIKIVSESFGNRIWIVWESYQGDNRI